MLITGQTTIYHKKICTDKTVVYLPLKKKKIKSFAERKSGRSDFSPTMQNKISSIVTNKISTVLEHSTSSEGTEEGSSLAFKEQSQTRTENRTRDMKSCPGRWCGAISRRNSRIDWQQPKVGEPQPGLPTRPSWFAPNADILGKSSLTATNLTSTFFSFFFLFLAEYTGLSGESEVSLDIGPRMS